MQKKLSKKEWLRVLMSAHSAVMSMPYAYLEADHGWIHGEKTRWERIPLSYSEYHRQLYNPWSTWTDGMGSQCYYLDDESEEAQRAFRKAWKRYKALLRLYPYSRKAMPQWLTRITRH